MVHKPLKSSSCLKYLPNILYFVLQQINRFLFYLNRLDKLFIFLILWQFVVAGCAAISVHHQIIQQVIISICCLKYWLSGSHGHTNWTCYLCNHLIEDLWLVEIKLSTDQKEGKPHQNYRRFFIIWKVIFLRGSLISQENENPNVEENVAALNRWSIFTGFLWWTNYLLDKKQKKTNIFYKLLRFQFLMAKLKNITLTYVMFPNWLPFHNQHGFWSQLSDI